MLRDSPPEGMKGRSLSGSVLPGMHAEQIIANKQMQMKDFKG
jgi:hypothetical protein